MVRVNMLSVGTELVGRVCLLCLGGGKGGGGVEGEEEATGGERLRHNEFHSHGQVFPRSLYSPRSL